MELVVKVGTFKEDFLGDTKTIKHSKIARKALENLDVKRTGTKNKGSIIFKNQAAYDKAGAKFVEEYERVAKNGSGKADINKTTIKKKLADLM